MKKPIKIIFLKEAESYHQNLPKEIQKKFTINFYKVKHGYRGDWFEKLKDSDGIFEFRVSGMNKFYRIFAFWDRTEAEETLVVGTHGYDKKENRTPKKEIKKAERMKEQYFQSKKE
jgi:phage-related protein